MLSFAFPTPPKPIKLLDTTLRDGLSTSNHLTPSQQKRLLKSLHDLHPDIIELKTLPDLPLTHRSPILSALAPPSIRAINRAYETVSRAPRNRLHVYTPLPTNPAHPSQLLRHTRTLVNHASAICQDVQYTPMHGVFLFHTQPNLLSALLKTAVRAGARTVTLSDTRGEATPTQFRNAVEFVSRLLQSFPHGDAVEISVHAHGNRDVALAHVVGAVDAGAHQVECTISGVGCMPALQDVVSVFDVGVTHNALEECVECFEHCFGGGTSFIF